MKRGILLLGWLFLVSAAPFTCKSESGNTVTWWAAFKFPSGYNYMYADINSGTLKLSSYTMASSTSGALAHTLNQIYSANKTGTPNDSAFVFYNDQKPDGSSSSSRGHTKGVVGLTPDGGFWLVHSVPKFPQYMANGYPGYDAAPDYGQSFLCITLGFNQFDKVGTQFTYSFPNYYDWNMPAWVPPTLLSAVTKSTHTTAAVSNTLDLTSTPSAITFTSFAKTSNWNNYLYENLVAPSLNSDLYVETWMNGNGGPLPTFCKNATIKYDVINVRVLSACGYTWKETQDHSKWAITTHNSKNVVCIGDINRQQSQNTRAGGTVCFSNSALWTSLTNAIIEADSCPTFL